MRQSAELDVFYQNGSFHQWTENVESVVAVGALCSALAVLVCCYQKRNRHGSTSDNGCDANYSRLENPHGRPDLDEDDEDYVGCQPATSYCTQYLKSCGYRLVRSLRPLGTRPDKHWFVVREARRDVRRLLIMSPLPDYLPTHATPSNLLNLIHHTAHPYIHPILHVGFHNGYIITVVPINVTGSLRDLIHNTIWNRGVEYKYSSRGRSLPLPQVQRLARQLLEALVWIKQRGMPTCRHLHAGNVIIQGGVARLAGMESAVLPLETAIPFEGENSDTMCFAHVLFEMCTGYRLNPAFRRPSPGHLLDLHTYPQVLDVLDAIFNSPDGKLPPIERLLSFELFRNIDLREVQDLAQSSRVVSREGNLTGGALALLRQLHQIYNEPLTNRPLHDDETSPNID